MACLAVVLNGPKAKNGRKVFESFVEQNKMSFWNRELVTAAEHLKYMGFMRPGTLFISGDDSHLQVLKDAWARRILKPAVGYSITSFGDLGAIQQVEQLHFVPLADVICDAISQLNRNGQPATDQTIRRFVARHCAHVAPPGIEMVRQTVSSLLATGFIYKMGEHYFVAVPTNSPPKQKATVECQTGVSIIAAATPNTNNNQEAGKKKNGIFARLFSRGCRPNVMPQPGNCVAFGQSQVGGGAAPTQPPPPPPPPLPVSYPPIIKNKFPTYHNDLTNEQQQQQQAKKQQNNEQKPKRVRRKRREAKLLSSSSECLNYGPIDPPELLPGCVEVVDAIATRRQKRKSTYPEYPIARTSTPIESDSAYSPSPVTDSNDDGGSHSEPETNNHTYINLVKLRANNDSTQFEDLTCATDEPPQILASQMRGVLISNL